MGAMQEGMSRCLVLVGPTGAGKTEHLRDVGRMLGLLPSVIRATSNMSTDRAWWDREFKACNSGNGGNMAPVIITCADRAPEAALDVAKRAADENEVALCLTMTNPDVAAKLLGGPLAGASQMQMGAPELDVIGAGLLASEGVREADPLSKIPAKFLESLEAKCSKQPHYDFGTRTLHQLCTQIGEEIQQRAGGSEEKKVLCTVIERCVVPRMTPEDLPILQSLVTDLFGVEMKIPVINAENRWATVVRNISSITTVEPDCMVLPVVDADEAEFFKAFSIALNAEGAVMARLPPGKKVSDYTAEQLLGTMPREGEEVVEGVLINLLRRAMDDNEPNKRVWIVMQTGECSPDLWESLHELLNDSGCINLATGEQLRLTKNLRYLFIMPNAGSTEKDTFSRSAIVYSNPGV